MVPGHQNLESRPRPVEAAPDGLARIEDLTVTFVRNGENVYALRGVSLDLMPGEIVGVVGESGSGKSVLGLSLLGLLPDRPSPRISGSVTVKDVDMVNAPAENRRLIRKRHMGSVFQDPMTSLNPTMKIGRQVQEAAGTQAEALRLLDRVGVPDARRRMEVYPVRALRRAAPAGDDRHGHSRRALPGDRRRTDHRPGRHRPGSDPRAHPLAATLR